jgi:hypothetical protein
MNQQQCLEQSHGTSLHCPPLYCSVFDIDCPVLLLLLGVLVLLMVLVASPPKIC